MLKCMLCLHQKEHLAVLFLHPLILLTSLHLDIDAGWEIQAHKCINGLRCRREHIYESLVNTLLKLLTRVFVLKGRTEDRHLLYFGWEWNRPVHRCARALRGVEDLPCRLVDNAVVVGFETDANPLGAWSCGALR